MPWLDIKKDGDIVGHEGRHRAASLLKDGIKTLPVGIRLYDAQGYPQYRFEWHVDGVRQKRYLGLDDIPDYWTNQFGTGFAIIAKNILKTFKWVYEGETP